MSSRRPRKYGDQDLVGLTVAHSEDVFREGEQVILTLQDRPVLDESDDILENVNLVDTAKADRNKVNRKAGSSGGYQPYQDDEVDEFGVVKRKTLLTKYDEEIEGQKKQAFKIGMSKIDRQQKLEEMRERLRREAGTVSLQVDKYRIASEYYTEEEMSTFKKPKKKQSKRSQMTSKSTRKQALTADDLLPQAEMDSQTHFASRKKTTTMNEESQVKIKLEDFDVEDMSQDQAAVEHQQLINDALKKQKAVQSKSSSAKKHKRARGEEGEAFELSKVKKESQQERTNHTGEDEGGDEEDEEEEDVQIPDEEIYGMVLEEDDLQIELQKTVNTARKLKQKEMNEEKLMQKLVQTVKSLDSNDQEMVAAIDDERQSSLQLESRSTDIVLNSTAEFCRTLGDIQTIKEENEDDEDLRDFEQDLLEERKNQDHLATRNGAATGTDSRNKWNEVDVKQVDDDDVDDDVEMEDEDKGGRRNLSEIREGKPILEEEPDVSVGVAGALKLAMKKGYLDKDLDKAKMSAKASSLLAKNYTIEEKFYEDDRHGRRHERYSGPISEFREKSTYNPEVRLEYIDDNGRLLNKKEAFRILSHKFHGKGPGKNKIDKRMKKLEQEAKLKSMISTDTPLGTLQMLQSKQKELQSAHVVLNSNQNVLSKKS